MKPCIILILLLSATVVAVAQEPRLRTDLQRKPDELGQRFPSVVGMAPRVRVLSLQDTGKAEAFRKLLEANRLQKGGLLTATYSHATPRGKVYTLTPDNMPCLVPDRSAVAPMPQRKGWNPDDRMNAWPRQKIIPQAGEGNNSPRH